MKARSNSFTVSPDQGIMSLWITTKEKVGALNEILEVFKTKGITLRNINSKPVQDGYEFTIDISSIVASDTFDKLKSELEKTGASVTVADEDLFSTNTPWYPRKITDLDRFASRVTKVGKEMLSGDHPGVSDPVYLERRDLFSKWAIDYKHGTPIPRIQYTEQEIATWGAVFSKVEVLYETHACKEHRRVWSLLKESCHYRKDNIPQLEDVSNFLKGCSGFMLRPVAGLLSSRDFLAGLAFRVFHSTQYIRHGSQPLYTPEPDVCHELLGHAPLFADPAFAAFSQQIGLASLGATDEDITRLATNYWFTIEFGLTKEGSDIKAYGAGLLSSFGELEYCLSDKPKIIPYDPVVCANTEYPVHTYQPLYFVADSFEHAKEQLSSFSRSLERPFACRYNAYTQSVETVNSVNALAGIAENLQADVSFLQEAIKRINK